MPVKFCPHHSTKTVLIKVISDLQKKTNPMTLFLLEKLFYLVSFPYYSLGAFPDSLITLKSWILLVYLHSFPR